MMKINQCSDILNFVMSDQNKLEILRVISRGAIVGEARQFSINALSKFLPMSWETLDKLLNQLEEDRFINQYVLKDVDGFLVALTQKGLDAVKDESFI